MKRWIKIVIGIIAIPIILIIAFVCYYLITNLQGEIEPYQLGNVQATHKVLVASQGSEFKNALVNGITQQIDKEASFISVVDVTTLDHENPSDWDAIIIIHTTQIHGMPKEAKTFMKKMTDHSNVVLVTTSGGGDEVISGYNCDAICSASRMTVSSRIIDWVVPKIQNILEKENLAIAE